MKGRRQPYGVDVRGKKGRVHVRAEGGLLVKEVGKSRFVRASAVIKTAFRSSMCNFPGSDKMALSLGAVRKDEETGRAAFRRGKCGLVPFMACLRHNLENYSNVEK